MADVLKKNSIEVLHATWKAASASATDVELTNHVTLSPGTWFVIAQNPVVTVSQAGLNKLAASDATKCTFFPELGAVPLESYAKSFGIATVTDTVEVYLATASSRSTTYTYTERGGIFAIKLV